MKLFLTEPGFVRPILFGLTFASAALAQQVTPVRQPGGGDTHFGLDLNQFTDERGNRILDFSTAGYMTNSRAIPDAPVRLVVPPVDGDDGARIQAALDQVAAMAPDGQGVRGSVLLLAGKYQVEGQLVLGQSGVVLRGQGPGEGGTTIEATGTDRRVLIRLLGKADRKFVGEKVAVSGFFPVGATKLTLEGASPFKDGEQVIVTRPSTEAWIKAAGMWGTFNAQKATRPWKPGDLDIGWDRTIIRQTGSELELDAPVSMALDPEWGGATAQAYQWPGRIEQAGVENLRLVSAIDPNRPLDEDHSWVGVSIENTRDAWVRRVDFAGFSGSAVSVWESASRVTVADCRSYAPVSELGGWRRHTFFTQGQQTLFLRCFSEHGRRDFSVGHAAAGPNAFVHCDAREALGDSGPIGPWATGVLYDNVNIDGGGLNIGYVGSRLRFAGWTAANSLLWQSTASEMDCSNPPTAKNWAIGCWSFFEGNGGWFQINDFVSPKSLMQQQVATRVDEAAGARIGPGVVHPPGGTRPSVEAAQEMVKTSNGPAPSLNEVIEGFIKAHPLPTNPAGAPVLDAATVAGKKEPRAEDSKLLAITNGWVTINGKLVVGKPSDTNLGWRGSIAPPQVAKGEGVDSVTGFVPGRSGSGYTHDIEEVARRQRGSLGIEHHPPLWYDRRRDDHERVRRIDGEVWPPFYELPYARTGIGTAWDGLSKYDLTKPNPFYFDRLAKLAGEFEQGGQILTVMHYLQHNILEAGGHWADYPWRSANNINDPGFPEPPPYAGDKRIFQAHLFYDVTHPQRQALHRRNTEMFLEELKDHPNVIHLLGDEYTGPLEFTAFWVRSAGDWEKRTGKNATIGLATTKTEQDTILEDPDLSLTVDLIDTRYWGLQGGINLAPRQQKGRNDRGKEGAPRSTLEYRTKYPQKAFIRGGGSGWDYVMQGGSMPARLNNADDALLAAIPNMLPAALATGSGPVNSLAETGRQHLVHLPKGGRVELDLSGATGTFDGYWVFGGPQGKDPLIKAEGGGKATFESPGESEALLWLRKVGP
jgi:Family of unknown function (DUF6298)